MASSPAPIRRRDLVRRHNPTLRGLDPRSPLQVGNGEFAFAADLTGLQTFPEAYQVPLGTLSQWGWHSFPRPPHLAGATLQLADYDTYGRPVGYPTRAQGQEELFDWLRANPHRLHLGRLGLCRLAPAGSGAGPGAPGAPLTPSELQEPVQTLDLWTGLLTSTFRLDGVPVRVETCCHPRLDLLAVRLTSPLVAQGRLGIALSFPAPDAQWKATWATTAGEHETRILVASPQGARLARRLHDTAYEVHLAWTPGGTLVQVGNHSLVLQPSPGGDVFELVCHFAPAAAESAADVAAAGRVPAGREDASAAGPTASGPLPSFATTLAASAAHWAAFWEGGGAIELADSRDPRALELERRIVLSQYLTAINCAGSLPPQETGLLCNSWFGKFHLEMHFWHAAHFPVWNRPQLLERSLAWYQRILPLARETARAQGYAGARWPKMVGPDGRESPSPVGPLLIWQQPHPILLAELCYRARPRREFLEGYAELVWATADFMASYAVWDEAGRRYVLGPPVIPAQENHRPETTWNPTFELAYWAVALAIAQAWRARLGLPPEPRWEEVRSRLSPLPQHEGLYVAHENCPHTFTERNWDHPSMLAAFGLLPGPGVDPEAMRRTLRRVWESWQWERTWGWDFPMAAMTAARLGEGELAVALLLMETTKNTYLASGHNWQAERLPAYLPGNGGLLLATAMMAAGWAGAPPAPGFPRDGRWTVRWEGLLPWL